MEPPEVIPFLKSLLVLVRSQKCLGGSILGQACIAEERIAGQIHLSGVPDKKLGKAVFVSTLREAPYQFIFR